MSLEARLKAELAHLPERPFWGPQAPDFTSNDYLGLVHSGIVGELLHRCPPEWRRGSTASRYLGGECAVFAQLEALVETLWAAPGEKALLFPSGLNANLAFWSCVPKPKDTLIFDREVHASIRQGIRLSGARAWSFPHNDFSAAEARIQKAQGEVFLVVESLYSMRGTRPDPEALRSIVLRYGCSLVIDEAHTTLLEPNGESWGGRLRLPVLARLFTFGKAVGLMGATWVGPSWLIEYVRRKGFAGVYTTAMPPLIAWAVGEVLRRSQEWEPRREALSRLIAFTRHRLTQIGLPYQGLEGPIALLPATQEVSHLKKLYPPTVSAPAYRLSLHAHNTPAEVEAFLASLRS